MTKAKLVFDPYSDDFYNGPYETYRRMREEAPVYYNEQYDFYALTRHEDVAAAYASIDQALTAQALMLSYNDAWMLILKSFIITAPAILVIRKPKGRASRADMH